MSDNRFTDHLGRPIIAVTGMGVITSLGQGLQDNWAALTSGTSGIHKITRFPTEGLSTRISGTVDFIDVPADNAVERSYAFARETTAEALAQAGLSGDFEGPLFLAAPPVEPEWSARFALADRAPPSQVEGDAYDRFLTAMRERPDPAFLEAVQFGSISERLSDRFGTRGLPVTLSTACASGATAIQLGVEAIRQGRTDRSLVVATDGSVSAEALIRFSLLSALSTQNDPPEKASKPFSKDRDGFVIAEGAATLVLESLESAVARGAKVLGILKGCGEKADHFHRTRSSPDGGPAIATIRAALEDAGMDDSGIGYINAHGTSTPENDKMEYGSMLAVFGERLRNIPVSSNKSMIGHTLTAAGAVEAVFSIQTMLTGTLPPTINYLNPDPTIVLDVVPNQKRDQQVRAVLSNSFGFGGQNASLVMTLEPA
ncbi:3-oxoacyl-[acyl-carrier-protein] synthase II (Beta-ketoacyl-ACP synthase II) [Pseudorhizobium banfieldiae]|uniref:3-oxoacyl-[acyl-carrier-protein] synthase II (Beta-ketoacyl-ACP synthase II) n=1 Tax=Pseudorhizobium banfieldiae TaxID=1125847 RepID=L0NFQ3_9HYPH|nr:beta-ketoacyl-ACP synthase [Pseudorhizobium banfieldiae]CAD6610959.1 beta-ketoacyl-ACP synthase II [arsenite-oxidising bacterium NT-25]CCF19704.1 3-oxoacyl-[acyl-carrier-protein] synthase II (Beta-ketoacyl-ACP synthase II) [Pseudorhizobium banfieldiae]